MCAEAVAEELPDKGAGDWEGRRPYKRVKNTTKTGQPPGEAAPAAIAALSPDAAGEPPSPGAVAAALQGDSSRTRTEQAAFRETSSCIPI